MADYERIIVKPISSSIGAEIGGVDVAGALDDATIAEIRRALLENLVIFFRDQALDAERHRAFTERFGKLFVHPNYDLGQDNPEFVYLLRQPGETSAAGDKWHTDTTMMAAPPMGAILYAMEVAPYGNDTLFANQYLAYETLSAGMQQMLGELSAVHNDTRVAGPQAGRNAHRSSKVREDADWQPTECVHPLVRTHPETGRKCLFVNAVYIHRLDGLSHAESQPLLDFLYGHCCRPEFTCRFQWAPGSIAFWDNRCTQHLALVDNLDHRRHMRRTQLAGEAVV